MNQTTAGRGRAGGAGRTARGRRILVVTGDVVGPGMAGPAIRAWHMAECLAGEHDVVLATTSGRALGDGTGFRLEAPDAARFEHLVDWCDVVVVQGIVLLHEEALRRTGKIMVVDVFDILHLEALELSRRMPEGSRAAHVGASLHALNNQALLGDFFVCASEKQRDYWVGHLSALGRVNAETYEQDPLLRALVDVAPFGLPASPATRSGPGARSAFPGIASGDEVLLWAGGIYDWLDPVTVVRAVNKLRHRRPTVRLVFMGTHHPDPEVPMMAMATQARRLARSLDIEDTHVFFHDGWVEDDVRQNWLLDADVGVSTHFDHAVSAYASAFGTRILDYLWAGLPVVATAGDTFADLIAREGLGRVVEPEDVDGLEHALFELLDDAAASAACRKNAERVRASLEWPVTLGPLLRFCRHPARAADHLAEFSAADHGSVARLLRRSRSAAG
ncbi:MAG: glycosyltransferase, partial [Acidimicrobiales bacterium]